MVETNEAPRESNRAIWPATIASASVVAQLVAGKATRDALFLSHFGLELLPAAMISGAVISAASVLLVSRVLSRFGPVRVVPATFAASALLFLIEWSISLKSERATAIAVYAHTAVFGTAIGSAFWSLVNERFDPHEAKRLVGRITSGGTVGGVVGGILVWRASAHLSVPMMLALLAAMSVVGLWGSFRMAPLRARERVAPPLVATGGIEVVRETPYLRDLAILVGAGAVMQALLDWLLSAHATHEYGQGPRLLGFFASFNVVVGVFTFAMQTGLTRLVLEKRGLGGTVVIQPASVAAGVVVALFMPAFWPVLALRLVEGVTRGSLYRSAYELFYTPLPNEKKRATKTLIDVGVDRIGTALGSVVLFVVARIAPLELQTRVLLVGVATTAATGWLIAAKLQKGYVAALAASLKSGAVALDVSDAGDLTTRSTLAETSTFLDRNKILARIDELQKQNAPKVAFAEPSSPLPLSERAPIVGDGAEATFDPTDQVLARAVALRSSDPRSVKGALRGPVTPALAALVVPLLANETVVREAVRALRKAAPRIVGLLVDHLLDPDLDPRVRRRIPRILKVCPTERTVGGLLLALRDPVFEVRAQVGFALTQLTASAAFEVPEATVFGIAHYELTVGRRTWTDGLQAATAEEEANRRGLAHVFAILGLVLEREPLALAHRALRSEDRTLRGTALEYIEVVLPHDLRVLLLPLLGTVERPAPHRVKLGASALAAELLRSRADEPRPR